MRFRREAARTRLESHLDIPRQVAPIGAGAMLGVVLLAGTAAATEIKYPASDPRVTLQVPDQWAVVTDAHGLFLTSPEKDSHVFVGIVGGNEKAVDAWAKDAREKLIAAGTKFDKGRPTRTLVAKGAPIQQSVTPNSFSGAPTIGQNFGSATSASALAQPQPQPEPQLRPFKVVQTSGSTLNGKPVDSEIYLFKIGTGDFLLFEQQSGPTDARGVDIEHSLKVLK